MAAGNFTLASTVVTLDVPRRVLVTTAANESSRTITIVGTGANGAVQTETMTGPNATTAYTAKDFKTITSVSINGAATGNISIGTNEVASTQPWVIDTWANMTAIGAEVDITGSGNYSLEVSYVNLTPEWDYNNNTVNWYPANGFGSQATDSFGTIEGPFRALRLTNNSGTATLTANLVQIAASVS